MASATSAARPQVLIVEDSPAQLALIRRMLEQAGFDVYAETSARAGYERVRADGIQLVVSDWMMPEMDGVEFCRLLRQHDRYVYVILVTVLSDVAHLTTAMDAGADDFLGKPFESAELIARVRTGHRIVGLHAELESRFRAMRDLAGQLRESGAELSRKSNEDELTGLFNRRRALEELERYYGARSLGEAAPLCIVFDLVGLADVNASLGLEAADRLLQHVATRLSRACGPEELALRLGGGRFMLLGPGAAPDAAERRGRALRSAILPSDPAAEAGEFDFGIRLAVIDPTQATTSYGLLKLAETVLRMPRAAQAIGAS